MDSRDAARLIGPAVETGGTWADLGAGRGTFTVALARLVGPRGSVYAIERDPSAVRSLEGLARRSDEAASPIMVVHADFTDSLELPSLDGALAANALHFVPDVEQARTLGRVASTLTDRGAVVIVEYDNRARSRWVPYPISRARLTELAREAGLGKPEVIGEQRSAFGGTMYAARMHRR